MERSEKWPQQACTTMFFLIPKNVTSERPIALKPTLIRWWEAEDQKWQSGSRSIALIGTLPTGEMEELSGRAKAEDRGAVALVLDLAKAFERVSLPVVWAWATQDIAGAVRLFRAPEASAVRRMRGGAAPDHHGHSPRVQLELFAFTHCSAGCVERSHKNLPSLKLRVTLRPW